MIKVIGFEGNLPTDGLVSWGTAALQDGQQVLNPALGRKAEEQDVEHLVARGMLTELPTAITIKPKYLDYPLVVVAIRLEAKYSQYLIKDTGRLGGLVGHSKTKEYQFYVYSDIEAFDQYTDEVIGDILTRLLFSEDEQDTKLELVKVGLTLNTTHAMLLATWVHLSNHDEFVEEFARANLHSDDLLSDFDEKLTAYRLIEKKYELIYNDGVAEGGGIDLNVAAKTFSNLHYIHKNINPSLQREYPFLTDAFSPPWFQEMKAASAHFSFSAGPSDRPLGERLARILELRKIEAILGGSPPEEMRGNERLEKAIQTIIQPSPDTKVQHRPIDVLSDREPVPIQYDEPVQHEEECSYPFRILGFQSGLMKDAAKLELRITPQKSILVSSINNGEGERPEGLEFLQTRHDFLFAPALLTVVRRVNAARNDSFSLLKMEFVEEGHSAVLTALPSSVVDGAFLIDVEKRIQRTSLDELLVEQKTLRGLSGTTLGMAKGWLNSFSKLCLEIELQAAKADDSEWLQPTKPPHPSALERLLIALHHNDGEAPVADVVNTINQLFDTTVRTNNTRREVIRHPDLLEFSVDDSKIVRLTDRGQDYLQAYFRAGGSTPV